MLAPAVPVSRVRSAANSTGRPRIGLTVGRVPSVITGAPTRADGCHPDYPAAVAAADGLPLLLPEDLPPDPDDVLAAVDGLLLTGGEDLDPSSYGEAPHPDLQPPDPARDRTEVLLARRAVELGLPLLAICRGCQLLNVALGGTLVQHLPDRTAQPHQCPERRYEVVHEVQIEAGSALEAIVGSTLLGVNSMHHQAVADVAPDLRPTARAADGTIEGLEPARSPLGDPFAEPMVVAVQWHPESMLHHPGHPELFRWLVEAAGRRPGATRSRSGDRLPS